MKTNNLLTICILLLFTSCQKKVKINATLEGDLFAKNVIEVKFDLPDHLQKTEFSWYLASSPDGEWEKIPGSWMNEIVLLTTYIDKYLKCEITCKVKEGDERVTASVISSKPIEYKGNPNTDWFRDAGFGIMVHFLKEVFAPEGGAKEWNDAVNGFSVEKFAKQASEAGVGYVLFTLGQNSGYYCSPNSAFNNAVGIKPGELCSIRDLPMDLMK
jgi:hypothetical protein